MKFLSILALAAFFYSAQSLTVTSEDHYKGGPPQDQGQGKGQGKGQWKGKGKGKGKDKSKD